MPCTLSTPKSARLAQQEAAQATVMSYWSSLLQDITISLATSMLATNDIDFYMAFRSICHNWRTETKDIPGEVNDNTDPTRFEPTKWALLEKLDDLVTFVNIDTGRFLRKSIPLLRRYLFVGATSGGLILLGQNTEPHQARLLNPFTGSIVQFKVTIPAEGVRAVAVTTVPLMVFVSLEIGDILWADQTSECFKRFNHMESDKPTPTTFFSGNVHFTDPHGAIFSSVVDDDAVDEEVEQSCCSAATIWMDKTIPGLNNTSPDASPKELIESGRYYLLESGGDLLLVTKPLDDGIPNQPLVRRVDTKQKVLKPIYSIDNRAIFVSHVRCLSIDVDKFSGIKGGCIYFVEPILARGDYEPSTITTYHVADGAQGHIMFKQGILEGCSRPFTIAQVFAEYCRSVHYHELYQMIHNYWDWEYSENSMYDESSSSESDYESELEEAALGN